MRTLERIAWDLYPNVRGFLHVLAGSAHAGVDVYSESLAALTFKYEKS